MGNTTSKLAAFVEAKLHRLLGGAGEPAVRAELARLRRGIGKAPGSIPDLWQTTLQDLPEELMGQGRSPSRAEWAVYMALTLFALHQQGSDLKTGCMHRRDETLGKALRRLAGAQGGDERVKRRFDAMATSGDMTELSGHMRGLVQLLKAEGIALDYAALAQDMYLYQFPESRDSVRLRWGRDFYRRQTAETAEAGSTTKEER